MPVFTPSPSGITLGDQIEETRRHLFSGQTEESNILSNGIAAGDTTFAVTYPLLSLSQRGCLLSIDLEEVMVWTTDGNSTVTACQRGVNGTTAASHSAGALITVKPKFSSFRIVKALNEELLDLSSPANGLFQVIPVDLTYNAAIQGYDITGATNVIRVLEARYQVPGPSQNWPVIKNYSLQRNMPTTTWASGFVFDTYQRAVPGLPIHLRYAAAFSTLVNTSDDVTAVAGLPASAADIPPMGAAIRLVAPREIKRNFTEAGVEPRRAEEVPPQAVMRSSAGLQLLRQQRIRAEAAVLASQYPWTDPVA